MPLLALRTHGECKGHKPTVTDSGASKVVQTALAAFEKSRNGLVDGGRTADQSALELFTAFERSVRELAAETEERLFFCVCTDFENAQCT